MVWFSSYKVAEYNIFTVITEAEQQERAFNLGLAGLLGSKVFNFGELVSILFVHD